MYILITRDVTWNRRLEKGLMDCFVLDLISAWFIGKDGVSSLFIFYAAVAGLLVLSWSQETCRPTCLPAYLRSFRVAGMRFDEASGILISSLDIHNIGSSL